MSKGEEKKPTNLEKLLALPIKDVAKGLGITRARAYQLRHSRYQLLVDRIVWCNKVLALVGASLTTKEKG